jgi:hypothetical protein
MTGIEVLGIVATAFQLSQQACVISSALGDIYSNLRDLPAKLQDGKRLLESLVKIANVIEQNQLLQTEAIQIQLDAIVIRTDALHKLIARISSTSKGKAFMGNIKYKEMIEHFSQLENKKAALALIIMEIHASLSGETLGAVKPISSMVDYMQQDIQQLNVGSR